MMLRLDCQFVGELTTDILRHHRHRRHQAADSGSAWGPALGLSRSSTNQSNASSVRGATITGTVQRNYTPSLTQRTGPRRMFIIGDLAPLARGAFAVRNADCALFKFFKRSLLLGEVGGEFGGEATPFRSVEHEDKQSWKGSVQLYTTKTDPKL